MSARYVYRNAAGEDTVRVTRLADKHFYQEHYDKVQRKWVKGLGDTEPDLYRHPELSAADTVYFCEGEKDADALAALGLCATTMRGGANAPWRHDYARQLAGATHVIMLPDNDTPGRKHADKVAAALTVAGIEVRVVQLPGLPEKGDVSDWLDAGGTREELEDLADRADAWISPAAAQSTTFSEVGVLFADVEPQDIDWLWYGYVPRGKVTVLDGDPGLGKSTLSLDLAARASRGDAMPGCLDATEPGGVVILTAEDDYADTVRPRLDAAGADVSRILGLKVVPDEDRPPALPDDLDVVKRAIERVDAKLVIVDPLMAYLSERIDGHKDQSVRRALHLLAALAEDTGAAVLVIRHLNKTTGSNPLYRGGGSIGIIGAARSGLLVASDPEDAMRRVLASTKCNIAAEPESLTFHLKQVGGASRVIWDGVSGHRAGELLAVPLDAQERSALDDAKDFLSSVLAFGPARATDVKKQAGDADVANRTLARAKAALGVTSYQEPGEPHGGWHWKMPQRANASRTCGDGTLTDPWHPDNSPQVSGINEQANLEPSGCQVATVECGTLTHPDGLRSLLDTFRRQSSSSERSNARCD